MKKYALMAMMALSLGFVACDEPEDAPGHEQQYPQESIMSTDAIAVASPEATATAVNFAQYTGEDATNLIPVLQITKLENFPEGYELMGVMDYAVDETFASAKSIDLQYDAQSRVLSAPVDAWETAHIELFTKNPRPAVGWVQFHLYAVSGTAKVDLGPGANFVWNRHALTVTPLPAAIVIEDSYTLIANGQQIPMVATNPENIYFPPTFSAVVNVEEGETVNVTIVSKSGKVYGLGAEEGTIALGSTPIVISEVGPQKLEVNMEEFTYKIDLAIQALYAYTSNPKQGMELYTYDFVTYQGFAALTGSFMLTNDNTVITPKLKWGAGTDEDGKTIVSGTIALGGSKIPVETPGMYFLKVNLSSLTYESEYVEYFELIGGWDPSWGTPIQMEAVDNKYKVWEADLTITNGTEFKIRTNSDWDGADLGGTMDDLKEHGGNIVWNLGNGTYHVVLDLSTIPYTLTATEVN